MQPENTSSQTSDAVQPGATSVQPSRLIRLPEVMKRVGLSRSAIYKRMAEGSFPRSRSLGPKCAVWVEAEIDAWIKQISIII